MQEHGIYLEYEGNDEMDRPHFVVTRISEGFGFGEGPISGDDAEPEVLRTIDTTIETHPDIIVPVDREDNGSVIEDDGCGDGRAVGVVTRAGHVLKRSLNRAKVFGGAVAMAAAARIGLGAAVGEPLNNVFDASIDELTEKKIDFGAHTADHVAPGREGIDSGCGAIDGAPDVLRAVVKHEHEIRGVIKFLQLDDTGLDDVFANFRDYVDSLPQQPPYSGLHVMERIKKVGKVVKELMGGHRERRIVINAVRGYTVNQGLIRDVTGGKAQIFAFDSWRLEDIASNLHTEDSAARNKTLLSELVYTLGVASVLTPGDMPVYMIQRA